MTEMLNDGDLENYDSEDDFYDTMDVFQNTDIEWRVKTQKNPITKEITTNDLTHLVLSGVKLTNRVLGQGSYGTVYEAELNGTLCAAKQVDLSVTVFTEMVKQNFLLECLQHSKLSHPNIVKMLGVFYPEKETLPVLVMELMECNLTQLLKRSHNIPMYVKLSILQDVSRGLCYLHDQNPPIVHQALYSDNILFATGLTAKLGDFKTGTEMVSTQVLLSERKKRCSNDFLPDLCDFLKYDRPLNVYSFGCIVCHVITQKWPCTLLQYPMNISRRAMSNPVRKHQRQYQITGYKTDNLSVGKHQVYIDLIGDNLKTLVERCLQRNPINRPKMLKIHEVITSVITCEFT